MDTSLPCGTTSRSYKEDSAIIRTRNRHILFALFALLIIVGPFFLSSHMISLFTIIYIWIIAAHGLNILVGYCGQISLGHSAFMGIGAYTSATLGTNLGLPFWVSIPCAVLVAGFIGILFGLPSVRIKGFYLAMATLAAQFIMAFLFLHWESVTGGYAGMPAPEPELGGFMFDSELSYYYLVLFFAVLATFFAKNLARTKTGRAFVAIRDNDLAAEVMGMNLYAYKLLAFFIASCFAGLGGALWAHYAGHITPEEFTLNGSIWLLGMVIVGGLGRTMGAVFGVFAIKLLEEGTSYLSIELSQIWPTLGANFVSAIGVMGFAAALMLFLIFEPRGIEHSWGLLKKYYRNWPFSY